MMDTKTESPTGVPVQRMVRRGFTPAEADEIAAEFGLTKTGPAPEANDAHCLNCRFEMRGGRFVGLCPKCGSDRWHRTRLAPAKKTAKAETPAVKEVPCPDCYGGHFRPCNICGDSGVALLRIDPPNVESPATPLSKP